MDMHGYVWVYIGIYGYEGVIYGGIWVYMGLGVRYMYVHLGFIGISGNKVYLRFYVYYGYTWVCMGIYWYLWVHMELLFQTTRRRYSYTYKFVWLFI